ncbi:MAG: N-acetylmuramic acid 6-phosphate etherase [Tannerellaceae bacterium]|jgi:N-acetylmuramic acid 6-phosphate etherase|nr:N-acetylmuramic acid 6-phosphate etherase [Tannerellaceae bacterium]
MISITESPSEYQSLESMSVNEILTGMNREDAKVHTAVNMAIPQIEALVNNILVRMTSGGRLFYIGAGTSGRLGVLDASEIPPTFGLHGVINGLIAGGDTALRTAVEAAEDNAATAWADLEAAGAKSCDSVIGIAASGGTPYVVGGIIQARSRGLLTGCISCNPSSALSQAAEYPVEIITGPEFVTGSTRLKAGTAEKMTLNMISTALMIKLGRVRGNQMVNMQLNNSKLIDRAVRMLVDALHIPEEEAMDMLHRYGSVKQALDGESRRNESES